MYSLFVCTSQLVYILACARLCKPDTFHPPSLRSVRIITFNSEKCIGKDGCGKGVNASKQKCMRVRTQEPFVYVRGILTSIWVFFFLLNTKTSNMRAFICFKRAQFMWFALSPAQRLAEAQKCIYALTRTYACTVTNTLSTWYSGAKLI